MKKQICCLLAILLVGVSLSGCKKNPDTSGTSSETSSETSGDNTSSSADTLITLQNMPDFSGDMVSASVYGDILKLDDITPGLDTYSMNTTLYSLAEQKILGQISLPDAAWSTGCLDEGFYAVSLMDREYILYDSQCKETLRQRPDDSGKLWAFASVSPDGKYLAYGVAETAEIYLYSISDGTQKKMGSFSGYIETVGFSDGCFFLRDGYGGLIKIDPAKDGIETPYADRRLNFITPYFGLYKTEINFLIMSPNQTSPQFSAFASVDEIPAAAGKLGFVTIASEIENDILHIYQVNEAEKFAVKVPGIVQQVLYDDERLVIVAKEKDSEQLAVFLHNGQSAETSPMVFYDTDKMPPFGESEIPDGTESTPSKPESDVSHGSVSSDNESGDPSKEKVMIKGVPVIAQMPDYPTGCESVSAVMALQFAGETISVDNFIDHYLEKSSNFYYADGVRYGPNPYEVFIGNPRSRSAFGCMAPVIEKALVKYYASDEAVENTTGMSMEALCRNYIDNGIPVMVWTSIKMLEPRYTSRWTLPNGDEYTWLANEHCMVLIGYDHNYYYFNDPYTGKEVKYNKNLSENRYEAFGKQSLVIKK